MTTDPRYVVCLRNDGAPDLEMRRLSRLVPDDAASARGFMRVVDESGEDYVYPSALFAPVGIADKVARRLAAG